MIARTAHDILMRLARGFPIIAISGPGQSGKTTLARSAFPDKAYLSLEDPDVRLMAETDPRGLLSRFPDGAVLDEAQRVPELFSFLQTRVDADVRPGAYILTGSRQFGPLSGITQSLAGRVGMVQLLPFSLDELLKADKLPEDLDEVMFRGLYPLGERRSVVAGGDQVRSDHCLRLFCAIEKKVNSKSNCATRGDDSGADQPDGNSIKLRD